MPNLLPTLPIVNLTTERKEILFGCLLLIVAHALIMVQDTSRMFFPYMVHTYIMAFFAWYIHSKSISAPAHQYLFSHKVWLHPSALNDYKLFIFNFIVYFSFASQILMNLAFIEPLTISFLKFFAIPLGEQEPGLASAIVYTLAVLLATEFTYYLTHRAYHEIPFLWELHKVHHSAEVMTPITYIRAHPIDLLLQGGIRAVTILICSGVFLYFYPSKSGLIMVGSVDAGLFLYFILGANLHHSHIWLSFGKVCEHVLMSPAQHQIHHSKNPKHFDKNYGSMLSLWDWLFGSLYIPEKYEKIEFGLGEKEQKDYDGVLRILWHPMKEMFLIAVGKKRRKKPKSPKK